jgi:hypothetical protein
MDTIWQALCVFCAVQTTAPAPQISREAGDISYTHEKLSHGRHLLRLSVTDFWIVGWNEAREERMSAFAHKVAAATCAGPYKLDPTDRASWPKVHTRYAKQFVFHCG